jgi:hypothetical protein
MLEFTITPEGGVLIAGTAGDLRELANWLLLAQRDGHAAAQFVSDRALTTIDICLRTER